MIDFTLLGRIHRKLSKVLIVHWMILLNQVCCCSVAKLCLALYDPLDYIAHQVYLSFTMSQSLLKLMSFESVMPSNHLILCCSLFLLPLVFPASGSFPMSWLFISVSQSVGASASASVLPMNIQG